MLKTSLDRYINLVGSLAFENFYQGWQKTSFQFDSYAGSSLDIYLIYCTIIFFLRLSSNIRFRASNNFYPLTHAWINTMTGPDIFLRNTIYIAYQHTLNLYSMGPYLTSNFANTWKHRIWI